MNLPPIESKMFRFVVCAAIIVVAYCLESCSNAPESEPDVEDSLDFAEVLDRCESDYSWCIDQHERGSILNRHSQPEDRDELMAWAKLKTDTHAILQGAYDDQELSQSEYARWCSLTGENQ